MFALWYFCLTSLSVYVMANRVYPPTKAIQLSLGVSKATYLPLETRSFIQNGNIIENPSLSNPFSLKYNPAKEKPACSIGKWTAKSYEIKETEVLMYENMQQKLVVFGFRGTEPTSVQDIFQDFQMSLVQTTIDKTTFTTHKGFRDRYGFIASWFEREYREVPLDYTIVITGHSLGGAEATIAAVYAAEKLKRRPDAVVTYGSPKVGAQNFKDYYNQVVGCDRTLKITAKYDPVTSFPFDSRYKHVCDATKIDGKTGRFNFLKAHDLYGGYELGIGQKYSNMNKINFGCDQMLN